LLSYKQKKRENQFIKRQISLIFCSNIYNFVNFEERKKFKINSFKERKNSTQKMSENVSAGSFASKVLVQSRLVALNVLNIAFDAIFGRGVRAHHHGAEELNKKRQN
jgi:hypothetical protein